MWENKDGILTEQSTKSCKIKGVRHKKRTKQSKHVLNDLNLLLKQCVPPKNDVVTYKTY